AAQDSIKQQVREVEVRTGYHRWSGRHERAAPGDLASLSAIMSGCATKMASVSRKTRGVKEMQKFVLDQVEQPVVDWKGDADEGRRRETGKVMLRDCVALLQRRARMQEVDTDFFQHRIKIQLTAVRVILFLVK